MVGGIFAVDLFPADSVLFHSHVVLRHENEIDDGAGFAVVGVGCGTFPVCGQIHGVFHTSGEYFFIGIGLRSRVEVAGEHDGIFPVFEQEIRQMLRLLHSGRVVCVVEVGVHEQNLLPVGLLFQQSEGVNAVQGGLRYLGFPPRRVGEIPGAALDHVKHILFVEYRVVFALIAAVTSVSHIGVGILQLPVQKGHPHRSRFLHAEGIGGVGFDDVHHAAVPFFRIFVEHIEGHGGHCLRLPERCEDSSGFKSQRN